MDASWVAVISAITGAVSAGTTILVTAWKGKARHDKAVADIREGFNKAIFDLQLFVERAATALELRLENHIAESRHSLVNHIAGVAVGPIERSEQRIGALEQDMAVVLDRQGRRSLARKDS